MDCNSDYCFADTGCSVVDTDCNNDWCFVGTGCNSIDDYCVFDTDVPDSNASLNFHYDVGVNQYGIHKDFQN